MAGYIGNKAVGINVTTGDILGDVGVGGDTTIAGTLGVTGVAATNNIRINGDSGTLFFNRDTSPADIARIQYVHGNPSFDIGADGKNIRIINGSSFAETVRFGTNGDVTIQDGNLVVAAGHGIDFAAQTATSASGASAANELLNHYERGTWTPGFKDSAGNAYDLSGFSQVTGQYVRIGDLVFANLYVQGNNSTLSGNTSFLRVEGLPFGVVNTLANLTAGAIYTFGGFTGLGGDDTLTFRTQINSATGFVQVVSGGTGRNVVHGDFGGQMSTAITFSYRAA